MERTRVGSESVVRRAGRAIALLLAIPALIAACSAPGAGSTTAPVTAAPATSAPVTVAPATSAPATGLVLEVRADPSLGAVAVGKDGLSLYVFLNDKTPGKSACEGQCAESWPPLTVADASGVTAGTGVSGAVATITRTDGSLQVTLGGMPLYYFSGDSAAGDKKGQALNDVWYLSSPAGAAVDGSAEPSVGPGGSKKCSGPACY